MKKLTDTHAHLSSPDYDNDIDPVLERARLAGVGRIISIGSGYGVENIRKSISIARKHDNVWTTVGIHPHQALLGLELNMKDAEPDGRFLEIWEKRADEVLETLKLLASDPKVVAIGESGLDYHYDFAPREIQKKMFRMMIGLANETCKPCVVHDREAHEDSIAILDECLKHGTKVVFHCFSGDLGFARKVLDKGFVLSIPGVVTFNKAEVMKTVVKEAPIERLFLETDAPFLSPVPYRGKRNEPSFLLETAKMVAQLKGLSLDDVARITSRNAELFFGLPSENRAEETISYPIRDSLYLNITNRCTLACTFCAKRNEYVVKGHELKLRHEPEAAEVLGEVLPIISSYKELVFCGFGEPMLRPDLIKQVSAGIKKLKIPVRVNTDGLSNLVHGRDLTVELYGLVDTYSVSLNAPDGETYARICPSIYKNSAFDAVKLFIISAKKHAKVIATAVALPGLDVEAIRRVASEELGVEFRIRPYNEIG